MSFAKNMIDIESDLCKLGHKIFMPIDIKQALIHTGIGMNQEHCDKFDVIMDHFKKIENSDAIIVLNYPKSNIKWYIWWSSLMEIWLAYYLGKKIFILYPLPSIEELKYVSEILHMKPQIINWDLSKISL